MRTSEHRHNKLPKSSRPRARTREWSFGPCPRRTPTCDERFRHILRLRFGVPCVTPLADWKCNCRGHGGPPVAGPGTVNGWRGPVRATAGTRDIAPARPLLQEAADEGHNWFRDALATLLNRMPGVQAVLEPKVVTRRAPGDQRRGDINVNNSGTSWILDVGIICPGSQRLVRKGTDTIPLEHARALEQSQARRQRSMYDGKKTKRYSDQANFVPFIVETGGRTRPACNSSPGSCRWRPRARCTTRHRPHA
jgi:hypothetical protein